MQIIPFIENAAWEQQIELSGVTFILRFKWNALNEYWVMSIFNGNEQPIVYGIKVVTNYDLTAQFVKLGMPEGEILCVNIIGEWYKIERFSMGSTTELLYAEDLELEALQV